MYSNVLKLQTSSESMLSYTSLWRQSESEVCLLYQMEVFTIE